MTMEDIAPTLTHSISQPPFRRSLYKAWRVQLESHRHLFYWQATSANETTTMIQVLTSVFVLCALVSGSIGECRIVCMICSSNFVFLPVGCVYWSQSAPRLSVTSSSTFLCIFSGSQILSSRQQLLSTTTKF